MAAVLPTNGILTITATTQTFMPVGPYGHVQPVALNWSAIPSAGGSCIIEDADGNTVLELTAGAGEGDKTLDSHFFAFLLPWKGPIAATTLATGSSLRIYV